MKTFIPLLAAFTLGAAAQADTLLLSDFSDFAPDTYLYTGTGQWSEATAQSGATSFTIGDFGAGTPTAAYGNAFVQWLGETPQDWSSFTYVNLAGAVFTGNAAATINFYIEDNQFHTALTAFTLADFAAGLTTVSKQIDFGNVAPNDVSYWGFQVADFTEPAPAVGFTFDNVSVSTSAIPEPSTYAALLGGAVGAFVLLRRRFGQRPV